MHTVLKIKNLSLGFPDLSLFQDLSFDVSSGSVLAVLGANGSGKSTFIKALLDLTAPLEGHIHWSGKQPKEIGYLAQLSEFDRRFPIRVRDLVSMGAWKKYGITGRMDAKSAKNVNAAMELVGVTDFADASLHTLSGGQLQRTLFARVIMQDAPLILLDEPFAAVDQHTEEHLLQLINTWRDEGRTVIMVVHDLSSVLDHCDQTLLLGNGRALHGKTSEILTPKNLVDQKYLSESQAAWMLKSRAMEF